MYSATAISNIGYYALKKKAGLHNRGFLSRREAFDFESGPEFGVDGALSKADDGSEEADDGITGFAAFQEYKAQGESS